MYIIYNKIIIINDGGCGHMHIHTHKHTQWYVFTIKFYASVEINNI